jgi:DNA-binding phage protein
MDEKKISLASKLMRDRETPISEVCEAIGVSRATLYRYLEPSGAPRESPPRATVSGLAFGGRERRLAFL